MIITNYWHYQDSLAEEPDIFAVVVTYVTAAVNVVYSFKKRKLRGNRKYL